MGSKELKHDNNKIWQGAGFDGAYGNVKIIRVTLMLVLGWLSKMTPGSVQGGISVNNVALWFCRLESVGDVDLSL